MKTHIIHLEQDDNVISITDKLSWGKAKRVLLVFPTSPGLKLQKFDFLLIMRAAIKKGFMIGIVSRSEDIKLLSAELKIPVFRSIKHAQSRTWAEIGSNTNKIVERKSVEDIRKLGMEAKPNEPYWQTFFGVRLVFFSLGVLAVLLLSVIFIPSANIKLNFSDQKLSLPMELVADESIDIVNLSGKVPVHTGNVEVEASRLVSINTKTKVPDKFSVGKIIFTNLTEAQVEIPLGTIIARLDNSGVRFETIEMGDLPAGIGQTIELQIQALTPGEAGNMEANSLGSLIGDLGSSLSAGNPESTYGGADRITNLASESDRHELYGMLEDELMIKAIQIMQDQLAQGDIIFPDSVKIDNVIEEVYTPVAGQPGDRLSLDLKLLCSVQYASYSDLVRLGEPALKAGLPHGYSAAPENSIHFDLLNKPTSNQDGTTALILKANQNIVRDLNGLHISGLIQGKTIQDAYQTLEDEYGSELKPIVELSPSWWPWLPLVSLRIAINN